MQRERTVIKAAGTCWRCSGCCPKAPRAGPTLVFLHEGLGSIALWRDFPTSCASALACRVWSMTAGAMGSPSPWIGRASPATCTTRRSCPCPSVLDQAGVERPILIGHSDGGTIALLFAARFPTVRSRS